MLFDGGMADEMVATEAVRPLCFEIARRIAAGQPGTRSAVQRLTQPDLEGLARRLDAELAAFVELVDSPEATAGMDRFLAGELR